MTMTETGTPDLPDWVQPEALPEGLPEGLIEAGQRIAEVREQLRPTLLEAWRLVHTFYAMLPDGMESYAPSCYETLGMDDLMDPLHKLIDDLETVRDGDKVEMSDAAPPAPVERRTVEQLVGAEAWEAHQVGLFVAEGEQPDETGERLVTRREVWRAIGQVLSPLSTAEATAESIAGHLTISTYNRGKERGLSLDETEVAMLADVREVLAVMEGEGVLRVDEAGIYEPIGMARNALPFDAA